MISLFEQFRKVGYTSKEDDIIKENATCYACLESAIGSSAYTMHNDTDTYYLHKTCTEFPMLPKIHWHPLRLELDFVIGEDAACFVCNTPTIGSSPTYICCFRDSDDADYTDCPNFYLHKSCAELPMQINHHKHNIHPLSLLPRTGGCICNICRCLGKKVFYACVDCDVNVCVSCASEQRVLHHEGHKEHALTLMKKEALFHCDACWEEAKDSSYVCTICDFWIHESCAFSPSIIQAPTYHHDPLTLVYSVPEIHRNFERFCGICDEQVHKSSWLYYCHKCTYFVHMKCSTSTVVNENEADIDNEPDLVQFPLPSQKSIFDLIVTLFSKFQADFKGEVENSISMSTSSNDPHIIEKHWSHKNHPLEQLQFTISENDNDDSDDDKEVLICDGCIQPITVSHPTYYACIQCGFFLHSFCATKLPQELPVGASSVHPNHSLLLRKMDRFYSFVKCGVCCHFTNGFCYECQTCNINIDIRCVFLPTRIKHISHKHSLVQRSSFESKCSLTRSQIDGMGYACETCSDFQIQISCAIFPSRMDHRFDIHPITLRYPPFFHEGVIYCEICEEQVDNHKLLYHCSESEHSFHCECLSLDLNIKFGGTIKHFLSNRPHTLVLIGKRTTRKKSMYICSSCKGWLNFPCNYLFECDGCGYLLCCGCVTEKYSE